MSFKEYMNISEFAKISGTSRRNLLYYDEIGLFSPAIVNEKGYRYYSIRQFNTLDTINILKSLGMPLKEIKAFLETRTPEQAIELFSKQEQKIFSEMKRLAYCRKTLKTRIWRIKEALAFELQTLFLQEVQEEYFLATERVQYMEDKTAMKVYFDFFSTLSKHRLDIGYPMCNVTYLDSDAFETNKENRYQLTQKISKIEAQKNKSDEIIIKPAGCYLTEYRSGIDVYAADQYEVISPRMKAYIEENKLQIQGPVWEFWWLDDTVTKNQNEHIYQTSIHIYPVNPDILLNQE